MGLLEKIHYKMFYHLIFILLVSSYCSKKKLEKCWNIFSWGFFAIHLHWLLEHITPISDYFSEDFLKLITNYKHFERLLRYLKWWFGELLLPFYVSFWKLHLVTWYLYPLNIFYFLKIEIFILGYNNMPWRECW